MASGWHGKDDLHDYTKMFSSDDYCGDPLSSGSKDNHNDFYNPLSLATPKADRDLAQRTRSADRDVHPYGRATEARQQSSLGSATRRTAPSQRAASQFSAPTPATSAGGSSSSTGSLRNARYAENTDGPAFTATSGLKQAPGTAAHSTEHTKPAATKFKYFFSDLKKSEPVEPVKLNVGTAQSMARQTAPTHHASSLDQHVGTAQSMARQTAPTHHASSLDQHDAGAHMHTHGMQRSSKMPARQPARPSEAAKPVAAPGHAAAASSTAYGDGQVAKATSQPPKPAKLAGGAANSYATQHILNGNAAATRSTAYAGGQVVKAPSQPTKSTKLASTTATAFAVRQASKVPAQAVHATTAYTVRQLLKETARPEDASTLAAVTGSTSTFSARQSVSKSPSHATGVISSVPPQPVKRADEVATAANTAKYGVQSVLKSTAQAFQPAKPAATSTVTSGVTNVLKMAGKPSAEPARPSHPVAQPHHGKNSSTGGLDAGGAVLSTSRTVGVRQEKGKMMLQMKRPAGIGDGQCWLRGRVDRAIQAKRIGFIKASALSRGNDNSPPGDVFFHFDRVSISGLDLMRGDEVEYVLDKRQNKKKEDDKDKAFKVNPVKLWNRSQTDFDIWLDKTLEKADAEVDMEFLQRIDAHIIWTSMLDQPMTSQEANRVMTSLLRLKAKCHANPQAFNKMISAISRTTFFNPANGGLHTYLSAEGCFDFDLVQEFLLAVHSVDKSLLEIVFPFLQQVADVRSVRSKQMKECLFGFLRQSITVTSTSASRFTAWNDLPLVPTGDELGCELRQSSGKEWSPTEMTASLPVVRLTGKYDSADQYLDTYFRLLREDCFAALKTGVQNMLHNELDIRDMNVYLNVRLVALEAQTNASHNDSGGKGISFGLRLKPVKRILDWDRTQDLMFGNLLCITTDGTFNEPLWATVHNRDLLKPKGLLLVEPCADIDGSDMAQFIIRMKHATPATTVMVESPAYYKAYQPVLRRLQRMSSADMPFQEEIVACDPHAHNPPAYLDEDALLFEDEDVQGTTHITMNAACVLKDPSSADTKTRQSPPPSLKALTQDCRELKSFTKHKERLVQKQYTGDKPLSDVLSLLRDPDSPLCLDSSQRLALAHALTHRVSTVQGPPGTGKTYIGIKLVQLLLTVSTLERKTFLLLTYKNHALDEFLLACNKFMNVVRVGGRSDSEELQKCNVKELRSKTKRSQSFYNHRSAVQESSAELYEAAEHLSGATRFSVDCFIEHSSALQILRLLLGVQGPQWGRLYGQFCSIFPKGNVTEWLSSVDKEVLRHLLRHALFLWMPRSGVFSALKRSVNAGQQSAPAEEMYSITTPDHGDDGDPSGDEEEVEEVRRARGAGKNDKELKIVYLRDEEKQRIASEWPVEIPGLELRGQLVAERLAHDLADDPWQLIAEERALLVQHLIAECVEERQMLLMQTLNTYSSACRQFQEISAIETAQLLKSAPTVVGMTITGAAMNHQLLSALKPSIVIVEEAAEVLEPQIVAALGPWVQHLIMIGDHKQLRPSVESYPLVKNNHFDISMMERLLNNKLPHGLLVTQNRMRPEFSKLLLDIYPDYKDNLEVVSKNRAPPCMANSMFFWHHDNEEVKERSVCNKEEAVMVTQLALWFVQQGYNPEHITILTPYQGQTRIVRKLMREKLSQVFTIDDHPDFISTAAERTGLSGDQAREIARREHQVLVHTVDRYQGDENEVVIVSLTRSNNRGVHGLGFLKQLNRRCVAQSRAKCGLYFVGNVNTLMHSDDWSRLINGMHTQRVVSEKLPLTCQRHPKVVVNATTAADIPINKTFCQESCVVQMPCKVHQCQERCQPWHHHKVCRQRVRYVFPTCGHSTVKECCRPADSLQCRTKVVFTCRGEGCVTEYTRECHDENAELRLSRQCPVTVSVQLSCGHTAQKPCSVDKLAVACAYPCGRKLEKCGHRCSGRCGETCNSVPCEVCAEIERKRQEEQRQKIAALLSRLQKERDSELANVLDDRNGEEVRPDDSVTRSIRQLSVDLLQKKIKERQPQVTSITEIRNREVEIAQHNSRLKLKGVMEESQRLPFDAGVGKVRPSMIEDGFVHQGETMQDHTVWSIPSVDSITLSNASGNVPNYIVWCDVYLGATKSFPGIPSSLPGPQKRVFDSFYVEKGRDSKGGSTPGYYCLLDSGLVRPRYIVQYKCKPILHVLKTDLEREAVMKNQIQTMKILPSRESRDDQDEEKLWSLAESQFFRQKKSASDVRITCVTYYVEPTLLEKFIAFQAHLNQKYPGGKARKMRSRVYAFHTTDAGNVPGIMSQNFDVARVGQATNFSGKFGAGIYLSEYPDYSLKYGGQNKALLLCSVLPGKAYTCTKIEAGRGLEEGFDSHSYAANEQGYGKELCFFNPDQVLPMFHIEFEDKTDAGVQRQATNASGSSKQTSGGANQTSSSTQQTSGSAMQSSAPTLAASAPSQQGNAMPQRGGRGGGGRGSGGRGGGGRGGGGRGGGRGRGGSGRGGGRGRRQG